MSLSEQFLSATNGSSQARRTMLQPSASPYVFASTNAAACSLSSLRFFGATPFVDLKHSSQHSTIFSFAAISSGVCFGDFFDFFGSEGFSASASGARSAKASFGTSELALPLATSCATASPPSCNCFTTGSAAASPRWCSCFTTLCNCFTTSRAGSVTR
jgi:hypothetical protein